LTPIPTPTPRGYRLRQRLRQREMKVGEIGTGTLLLQAFNVFRKKFGILNCAGGDLSLIGEPSNSRAPVFQHRCRWGCSFGKIKMFVFPGVYAHRPSPMSIRSRLFSLFFAALRLCARQNLFGSSTEQCPVKYASLTPPPGRPEAEGTAWKTGTPHKDHQHGKVHTDADSNPRRYACSSKPASFSASERFSRPRSNNPPS